MSPRTGRPTKDRKVDRMEIRLTQDESEDLEKLAEKCGMYKSDVLKSGMRLVELQKINPQFEELSNCLVIRELMKKEKLNDEDRQQILGYIEFLKKRYTQK